MTTETLTYAPCPKCLEREKLATVNWASVGFMQCEACGYRSPELMAKPGTPTHRFVAAVVSAWNALPR